MKRRYWFFLGGLFFLGSIFLLLITNTAWAQSVPITNGLNYLSSSQNPDGSWGNPADGGTTSTTPLPATVSVLETLQALNETGGYGYSGGLSWLSGQPLATTDYLSERIHALSVAGTDLNLLLSYIDQLNAAWGGYDDYTVNYLDTALALQALKAAGYSDQSTINNALSYLLANQNADGGFGFYSGDDSNVYMTALTAITLQQFPQTTSLATALNKSKDYLLLHQNTDGGFGSSPSTVYETAYAYMALIGATTDATVLGKASNYLLTAQAADGSWNQDAYSTALALRALGLVKPNLSIASPDIISSKYAPTVGDTITITANIKNTGSASADNVLVQIYDGNPAAGGTLIGQAIVPSIPASGGSPVGINWTVPTAAAHVIFVKIDPLNAIDELTKSDNIAFRNITTASQPDLSIAPADIAFSPSIPKPGETVTITVVARNKGETAANNVAVDVYDGDPSAGGVLVGGTTVALVNPGDSGTAQFTKGFTLGNHYIYVVLDKANLIAEGDETNNSAMKNLAVGSGFIDLSIIGDDITFTPAYPVEGNLVSVKADIHNESDIEVNDISVGFYLGDPEAGGVEMGFDIIIPSIFARGTVIISTQWDSTGHAGNNNIFVKVDLYNSINETSEVNNKAFKTLKVASKTAAPDLALSSADINFNPSSPNAGDMVNITANVRNIGTADVSNVPVEFSLGDPDVGGTLIIGSQTIPFIAKGSSAPAQIAWNAANNTGTHEIYVNVDPFNDLGELIENNNKAHTSLTINELQGPDLTVASIDATNLITDTQKLEVSGSMRVTIENKGNQPTNAAFEITVFEDRNKNKKLDTGTDNVIGKLTYANNISAGTSGIMDIPVSGKILFKDNLLYVMVDSGNLIEERDETNNLRSTGQQCEYKPPVGTFNPVEKWAWTGSSVLSEYNQVMHMPVVARIADTNGDGVIDDKDVPAIIFTTFKGKNYWNGNDGILRAIRGDNGQEIFTVTDTAYRVAPCGALAVADIDNDGFLEIIASKSSGNGVIAFNHDGTVKWTSTYGYSLFGGPAIADLDKDGKPEIILGATVLNNNGTLKWQGNKGAGLNNGYGPLSVVADIDLDGFPEVIAGNTVYKYDGTVYWQNTSVPDGFVAVANFDADLHPEIVLISYGNAYLLKYDGSIIWGPKPIPGGGRGGAPTIADFNGDGKLEIGVAGAARYVVFKSFDGSILWQSVTSDQSSHMTGSSVYDFDGDGKAEVVYNDEQSLRIYRGSDGAVLFSTLNSTATLTEYPLIVDVDNDNRAEIVVIANNAYFGAQNGIRVFKDQADNWVNTRKIWNQHSYHITNVNDDGTIPKLEKNNWEIYNNYRCNSLLPEVALGTPDLTTSYLTVDQLKYPASVNVSARIGNGGAVSQIAGVDIGFYDGDPSQGGIFIGTVKTTKNLEVGDYEDVSVTWNNPTAGVHTVYVVADKDNRFNECRENNNIASGLFNLGVIQPPLGIPDLTLSPSDMVIIPPGTIEGQPAMITAIIHNIGTKGASDVVTSFYDGDLLNGGTLIGSAAKSYVEAGATAYIEVPWSTFGQSGMNYIHVVIDPQNTIIESNENNNFSLIAVDVTPPSKPDLAVTSSDITFSNLNPKEGEPLTINATIHNLGVDAGDIGVNLYDGDPASGGILLSQKNIPSVIPFGGNTILNFSVDTVNFTGNHQFYVSVDPNNKISEISKLNNLAWNSLVIGQAGISLTVATDKLVYSANENVQIAADIKNLMNSARSGIIEVKVLDTVGNLVSNVLINQDLTLGPNEEKVINYTWNTAQTLAGNYKVYCQFIEGGNAIARASTLFDISSVKSISSKVTTDKMSSSANESVTITSQVQSASVNYIFTNLTAQVTLTNSQGQALFTDSKTIPTLARGQLTELKSYWNTAANPPGTYNVTLEVREGTILLSTSTASFTISGTSQTGAGLKGTITASPNPVYPCQDETVTFSITNNGNEDLANLSGQVLIIDPDTQAVKATLTGQPYILAKGITINDVRTQAMGSLAPKVYLAVLQAATPAMSVPKTLVSTNFTLQPDKTLTSKVATDKLTYTALETVAITFDVQNTGHACSFSNLNVKLTLNNSSGAVQYSEEKTIDLLNPAQLFRFKSLWDTGLNPPGTYTTTLEVRDGTTVISTSTANFVILGSSITGAGLTGTITASPNPVYVGKDETLTYSVTGSGNEDMADLQLKVTLIDPDTQAVKLTFDSQCNLLKGETYTEGRAVSTAELAAKTYLVNLQTATPGMAGLKALGSTTFEVKGGLELTQSIPQLKNVLVWLNYSEQECEGHHDELMKGNCPQPGEHNKCPDRALIEQALKDAGVSYYIVTDKKDFQTELRNPVYTDFMILGDYHPLEDHYAEELREQVYSGKGLISSRFHKEQLEKEVLGIKFIGHLLQNNYPVELIASEISDAGTMPSRGKAEKVKALNPAEIIGWIVESSRRGTTKYPGVIKRPYGKGKILYFAFDLGLSTGNYGIFAGILKNSLSYIHTPLDVTALHPYQLIPVEIKPQGSGGDYELRVTETYPAELKLYDPSTGAWITDNPWVHNLTLKANESKSLLFYVLLPDKAGTYTLTTQVEYLEQGVYKFYQNLSIDLAVDKDMVMMADDIIASLKALSVSVEDQSKLRKIIHTMEEVKSRTADADEKAEENIEDILEAIENLISLAGVDPSAVRLKMDELLQAWEGR